MPVPNVAVAPRATPKLCRTASLEASSATNSCWNILLLVESHERGSCFVTDRASFSVTT